MKTIILLILSVFTSLFFTCFGQVPLAKRVVPKTVKIIDSEKLIGYFDSYLAYKEDFQVVETKTVGALHVKSSKIPVYCSSSVSHKMGFKKIQVDIKKGKIERLDFVDCNYNVYTIEDNVNIDLAEINYGKIKLWSTHNAANKKCERSYINLSEVFYLDLISHKLPTDTVLNFNESEKSAALYNKNVNKLLSLGKFVEKQEFSLISQEEPEKKAVKITENTDTLNAKEVEEVVQTEMEKFKEEFSLRVQENKDKKYLVGQIFLRDSMVHRYCEGNGDTKIKIKRVKLNIENGTIVDIQIVDSNYEVFSNGNSPVELKRLNKRNDKLFSENGAKKYSCEKGYLKLSEIIYYEKNTFYTPKDTVIVLTSNVLRHDLFQKSGIDQHVDLRIFTDLLGLMGNESNGLVQTEFHVNSDLHQKNILNKPWYVFKYFDFIFRASKFDSDHQRVLLDENSKRSYLNQRSWLNTKLNLNLFAVTNLKSRFNMSIDILGGFDVVEVYHPDFEKVNIGLPQLGTEFTILISSAPNFNASIKVPITFQNAPFFSKKEYSISNTVRTVLAPQIEFFWHPLEKEEDGLFGRITYVNVNGDGNPYWTFQVGYNMSLANLFQEK